MGDTEQLSSIVHALGSPDAEERRQATALLGQIDLPNAMPLLLSALGDEDWRVRKEATLAARVFVPAPPLLAALIEVLASGDNVGQRNAAVDVLAFAGAAATAALAGALPSLDADGRKLAVETLGRSRDPSAIEPLAALLDDADDNVRQTAIEAIAQVGVIARERARGILLGHLDDRDRLVRLAALSGLRNLEVSIPWARLAPLLADPMLRAVALSAAALADVPAAAPALSHALATDRGTAFAEALAALARLVEGPLGVHVAAALAAEGEALGRRLVALSADVGEPPSRRTMALRLAAAARAPSVVDVAFAVLSEEMLTEGARRALRALGAEALPAMVDKLADASAPAMTRAELVDVIAEIAGTMRRPPPSAVLREDDPRTATPLNLSRAAILAALRAAATDPDRGVAASALTALARLGGEEDLALAAAQTRREVRGVALAAENALSALAGAFPEAARKRIQATAHDEDLFLASALTLGALATVGAAAEGDAALLARIATTGDTRARRAAVLAASEIGDPVAMEILSVALTDEEHEVQLAAARALGRLSAVSVDAHPSEILDLVERSGAADLVAATLRAIGEGMSASYTERRSFPPAPPLPDLVEALSQFARSAQSSVAIAAVDALGQAFAAGSIVASEALVLALEHPDLPVAKAAAFKLAESQIGRETLGRVLEHPTLSVRARAAEMLAEADGRVGRERASRYPGASRGRIGAGPSSAPGPSSTREHGGDLGVPSSRGPVSSSRDGGVPSRPPGSRRR